MKITVKNNYGKVKRVKIGLSWTFLFFGFFVPLFRGDMKNFMLGLVIDILGGMVSIGIITLVYHIYMFIKYNDDYLQELYRQGYHGQEKGEF